MDNEPEADCQSCPRLAATRADNRRAHPGWFNAPVPSFGDSAARLLIIGLAPGLQGANRTGRPFTGDYAGVLLYGALTAHGFTQGNYAAHAADGLTLQDCRITNAVRCVPPQNKPENLEIVNCRKFLDAEIKFMPQVVAFLALGRIAHDSVALALGLRLASAPFAHGARHELPDGRMLFDSYHCSRYNTNTGRLTPAMFDAVFNNIRQHLGP